MDDLIAFLRARLDEDKQVAREAEGDCWHECNDASIAFHERFSADRVLREVEAKRRVLDEYEAASAYYGQNRAAPAGELYGLLTAVKLLALPFADHEDYCEEWKP